MPWRKRIPLTVLAKGYKSRIPSERKCLFVPHPLYFGTLCKAPPPFSLSVKGSGAAESSAIIPASADPTLLPTPPEVPRAYHFHDLCYPQGVIPLPEYHPDRYYLDGYPPPTAGVDKFLWLWQGKRWTYRFTVIENPGRMDKMLPGASKTMAFFPSLTPTSSREEMRECARMLANKGHQCLLVEFPGFHSDPHINQQLSVAPAPDDNGIFTYDNHSLFLEHGTKTLSGVTSSHPMSFFARTAFRLLRKRAHRHFSELFGLFNSTQPADRSCPGVSLQATRSTENAPHSAYNHIHRSFCRQYLRFLMLHWGAQPLSIVATGESCFIILQAVADLLHQGAFASVNFRHSHHRSLYSYARTQDTKSWRDLLDDEHDDTSQNDGSSGSSLDHRAAAAENEAVLLRYVRDKFVADLLQKNLEHLILVSPTWKSPIRWCSEMWDDSDLFSETSRQELYSALTNLITDSTAFARYLQTKQYHADSIAHYLSLRYERPVTGYAIHRYLQKLLRKTPNQLFIAWFCGFLEPCSSLTHAEALFHRLCVSGIPILAPNRIHPANSNRYRVPRTLVLVGRSCVDQDYETFNAFAKHCVRLDQSSHCGIQSRSNPETVKDGSREHFTFQRVTLPAVYRHKDDWNYLVDYTGTHYRKKTRLSYYKVFDVLVQLLFPLPRFTKERIVRLLHPGHAFANETQKQNPHHNGPPPSCIPVKGSLMCLEEFPRFAAECIDQYLHTSHVDFDELERYWVPNPLYNSQETLYTFPREREVV